MLVSITVSCPLVCKADGQLASFVTMIKELPLTKDLFLPGLSGSVIFNGDIPNTKVWALKCNFARFSNNVDSNVDVSSQ